MNLISYKSNMNINLDLILQINLDDTSSWSKNNIKYFIDFESVFDKRYRWAFNSKEKRDFVYDQIISKHINLIQIEDYEEK